MTLTPFRPNLLLRNGHLQTLAGAFLPAQQVPYRATPTRIQQPDGQWIAIHDDCPPNWQRGEQVALLLHGLVGCHASPYVARAAAALNAQGIRTYRMDQRGCGVVSNCGPAIGHAGRRNDAVAALAEIARQAPDSPVTLVGFSLGANITLSTLALAAVQPIPNLAGGIAVGPPVDLSACCRALQHGTGKLYDRYFLRMLLSRWSAMGGQVPTPAPRTLYDFDDRITAPLSGFVDAEDYYTQSSSGPMLSSIKLPTVILTAQDDPVVPIDTFRSLQLSSAISLHITPHGGHLGYLGRKSPACPTGRWLEHFVVQSIITG